MVEGRSHLPQGSEVCLKIGRHNTLDKVAGECLARNFNSPTHLAVELAREWNITLIGYARGKKMHVYTGWERITPKKDAVSLVFESE